jgi:hypothetical protein
LRQRFVGRQVLLCLVLLCLGRPNLVQCFISCCAMFVRALFVRALLYCALLRRVVLCRVVLCRVVLCRVVLCCTLLCRVSVCSALSCFVRLLLCRRCSCIMMPPTLGSVHTRCARSCLVLMHLALIRLGPLCLCLWGFVLQGSVLPWFPLRVLGFTVLSLAVQFSVVELFVRFVYSADCCLHHSAVLGAQFALSLCTL